MKRNKPMRDFEYLKEKVFKENADLKEFWKLLKEWYADSPDKHSLEDIISWMDDFVENPKSTLKRLEKMNESFEEATIRKEVDNG